MNKNNYRKLYHSLFAMILMAIWGNSIQAAETTLDATIEMTCLPAPSRNEPPIGPLPPCLLPVGVAPEFISPAPEGWLRIKVKDNDTARINIQLAGLAEDLVMTAWAIYFFPNREPDPIFLPIGPDLPPIAGQTVAVAATTAGFTAGLARDPNEFKVRGDKARLKVKLDWNPLRSNQGPLRNEMTLAQQVLAPIGSGAEQPPCCIQFGEIKHQNIGSSYLRRFDPETGFQVLGPNGRPELIRSPVPVAFIAIAVHLDKTTHGRKAGVLIPPIPGLDTSFGDHFLLGLFDLRALHME